jgi:hypothetical protein
LSSLQPEFFSNLLEFPHQIVLTINAQLVMVFAMKISANFRIDERDKIEIRETDNQIRVAHRMIRCDARDIDSTDSFERGRKSGLVISND